MRATSVSSLSPPSYGVPLLGVRGTVGAQAIEGRGVMRNSKPGHALDNVVGQCVQRSRYVFDTTTAVADSMIMTRHVRVVMGGAIFIAKDFLGQPMPYQQIERPVHRGKTDLRLVLTRR